MQKTTFPITLHLTAAVIAKLDHERMISFIHKKFECDLEKKRVNSETVAQHVNLARYIEKVLEDHLDESEID